MSTPLITPEFVSLDANLGSTKTEVITSVAGLIAAAGRADADGLAHDTLDRESKSPTGMPGGFAIPHCRSAAVYLRYPWGSPGCRPLSTSMDLTARPTSSL